MTPRRSDPPAPALRRWLAVAILPLALATACASCADKPPEQLSVAVPADATLTAAGRSLKVELALTQLQRNHGLMARTQLDEDAGMLFVFPDTAMRKFWMKDTLIPLDIVFLDADGTVQNVEAAQPFVEQPGYFSARPARMVLEVNQGWCARHGLQPGDRVTGAEGLLPLATP